MQHADIFKIDQNASPQKEFNFTVPADIQEKVVWDILKCFGADDTDTEIFFGDVHPLCLYDGKKMYITAKMHPENILETIREVIHEAGHGFYRLHMPEQNIEAFEQSIDRTYNGIDEAAAMFMEHYIFSSDEFKTLLVNILNQRMSEVSQTSTITKDDITQYLTRPATSLNRRTAPVHLYPAFALHRAQLEHDLVNNHIEIPDLRQAWTNEALNIFRYAPPEDSTTENWEQDPQWALGEFRFASGYLIGCLVSAQLYDTLLQTAPEALEILEQGDGGGIIGFAKEHLYHIEKQKSYLDFLRIATGKNYIDIDAFLRVNNIKDDGTDPTTLKQALVV